MSAPTPAQVLWYEQHASDNKGPSIIIACGICLFLPVFTVMLRLIARRRVGAALGIDDYSIMLALPAQAGYCIAIILDVKYGLGRHIIFVKDPSKLARALLGAETAYSVVIVCTKLSLLFLYNRIFPSKTLKQLSFMIGGLVIVYSVVMIIVVYVQCIPLAKLWTFGPGRCLNASAVFVTLAVTNVVADLLILALPVRFVLSLHLDRTRKYQLLGIFALGGIVCIFGIVRCFTVREASSVDLSWAVSEGAIWSLVEISVGVVGACLPTLRPIFVRFPTPVQTARSYLNQSRSKEPTAGKCRAPFSDLQNCTLWRDEEEEASVPRWDGEETSEGFPLEAVRVRPAKLSDEETPLPTAKDSHDDLPTPSLPTPSV